MFRIEARSLLLSPIQMPTYEFRCPNGHAFDRFFGKISDAPTDVPCPECGATAHVQISGGAGLVFKGSGFYLTDYGKNAHRGSAPKADSKSGESSGGESKSGDAKPAADNATKSADTKPSSAPATKPDKASGASKSDSGKKSSGGSTT